MGLLGALAALPLAPARGVAWVAEKTRDEAERQYYDPENIRRQLEKVATAREEGTLDDAEADALEESLVARLLEANRRRRGGA